MLQARPLCRATGFTAVPGDITAAGLVSFRPNSPSKLHVVSPLSRDSLTVADTFHQCSAVVVVVWR